MKALVIFSLAFMLNLSLKSQQINIPTGTKPTIDGVLSPNEWSDADSVDIEVQANWTVKVYYKHTNSCLYIAFTGLVTMFGERYPDVMLDINNDRSTSWNGDDWWLHASYNDCEGKGEYNKWTSCQPAHSGWTANNFPLISPGIIEMEITYAKIGISNMSNDTLGLAFEVSDTYSNYHYYPSGAIIGNPSTWTNGRLSNSTSIKKKPGHICEIFCFPNPSTDYITIQFPNPFNEKQLLTIYNGTGQLIKVVENIIGTEINLEYNHWTKGLYYFKLQDKNGNTGQGDFLVD